MNREHDPGHSGLCVAFHHLATRTWERMENNFKTPIRLREDGITSMNLQDLYYLQSTAFTFVDFTPFVESRVTGADWEWWFQQSGSAFGAAVQAKCLQKDGSYNIEYVPPGTKKPQIERLLRYCRDYGVYPMYCFYNWWQQNPVPGYWPCGSFGHQEDRWGCAIADGTVIWRLHRQGHHDVHSLHKSSLPWHCIVCCPSHYSAGAPGPGTRAAGILQFLQAQGPGVSIREEQSDEEREPLPGPHTVEHVPERISALLETVQSGREISAEFVREFFGDAPPRRVVVVENEHGEERHPKRK